MTDKLKAYQSWRKSIFGDPYETDLDKRMNALGVGSPEAIIYEKEVYEDRYLSMEADNVFFREMRKVVLAREMDAIRAVAEEQGEKISEARCESQARKSTAYYDHLKQHYKCMREMAPVVARLRALEALVIQGRKKTDFLKSELQQTT